jgi:hypothetical protein
MVGHVVSSCRADTTTPLGARARRVPPLQGGEVLFGPSSQGVALGYRVIAPSARKPASAMVVAPGAVNHVRRIRSALQPEGLQPVSPGQRPGNSPTHKIIRPERAAHVPDNAQVRDPGETIPGRSAEILDAGIGIFRLVGTWGVRIVPPLQGGVDLVGPSSPRALPWAIESLRLWRADRRARACFRLWRGKPHPNGVQAISLGQRPRNSGHKHPMP